MQLSYLLLKNLMPFIAEFVNPCLKGEPYREKQTALVRYCSRNSPTDCPQQFWCHLGANTLSTVCCPGGNF